MYKFRIILGVLIIILALILLGVSIVGFTIVDEAEGIGEMIFGLVLAVIFIFLGTLVLIKTFKLFKKEKKKKEERNIKF